MPTDSHWTTWGERDPYYAVVTCDRYRRSSLSAEHLAAFFASGEEDARRLLTTIDRHIRSGFIPSSALDFGCGTGRVALALARVCSVTGVDVAPGMLREAAVNAEARGINGMRFLMALDEGVYDLVHSFMVFQHIPVKRGMLLAAALLDRIAPAGVGVLHFVYRARASAPKRIVLDLLQRVPAIWRALAVVLGRSPADDPPMLMYPYPLERVLALFQERGFHTLLQYTNHGGNLGVLCYVWRD
jgi:SAM-dependent methyltransferase